MPIVMAVLAIVEPCTTLLAPRVAALPRAQITFFAWAPLINSISVSAAVTRVVPAWKRNWASASTSASKMTLVLDEKLMALPVL